MARRSERGDPPPTDGSGPPDDEPEVLARARAGDRGAFDVLYLRYRERARRLAWGFVRDPDQTEDIVQEAFVKAFRNLGSFKGDARFTTWMHRIVVNAALDHLRRRGRTAEDELDEAAGFDPRGSAAAGFDAAPRLEGNPHRNLARKEILEHVQRALDELPPYHRAVVRLCDVEGLSYKEIAKVLHIPVGTVMSRLHHARKHMQKLIAAMRGDRDPEPDE